MKSRFWIYAVAISLSEIYSSAQQSAFQVNYQTIRNSVVFIYSRGADGQTTEDGTGFLLSVPQKSDPTKSFIVLVTARHMVDPSWDGCSQDSPNLVARFNKKDFNPDVAGSVGTVDYELPRLSDPMRTFKWLNWMFPADGSADLAFTVLSYTDLAALGADFAAAGLAEVARPNETRMMDTGSQIMSAGLFPGLSGRLRNYPIFKFGYVSSRPTEKIVLGKDCAKGIEREETAWLIAASLVPGNSGSPILYIPVGFNGLNVGGGRPSIIGVQSSAVVGWDVAGMTPIKFLIDAIRAADMPGADLSMYDTPAPPSTHGK
jgi:hypothetical protein